MVRLQDAKDILCDYYAVHTAARADFERMERWVAHGRDHRLMTFAAFALWFAHHRNMLAMHHKAEQTHFFPHLQSLRPDDDFLAVMQTQDNRLESLQSQVLHHLRYGDSVALDEPLQQYVVCAREHLDEEESLYVPRVLECYTRDSFHELERRYRQTMSWSEAAAFVPWIMTNLSLAEQAHALKEFSWPWRHLYARFWSPAYHQRYPSFLVTTPEQQPSKASL